MDMKKVLVIEDSSIEAEIVKEILEQDNIELAIASTGEEGLQKAKETKPDLVILDLMLPGMSGYDVCGKIKADPELEKTIVVVYSIKHSMADIDKAFKLGADDYIMKPPVPEFLARKVKLYLGLR